MRMRHFVDEHDTVYAIAENPLAQGGVEGVVLTEIDAATAATKRTERAAAEQGRQKKAEQAAKKARKAWLERRQAVIARLLALGLSAEEAAFLVDKT